MAIHLHQDIKLTGLNTKTFGHAIDSIVFIHTIFSCQFKEGLWETWQPSAFGGSWAIDMSNRYFTSRQHDTQAVSIPFHKDVDPEGILLEIIGADLIHCEENLVLYYEFFASDREQNERSGNFYLD